MSVPLRIAVAEDEPMNLRRLVRLLEDCGCEVVASFPEAGLLRIHRHLLIRPEAVLGIRSAGGGTRVLVRMIGGIELEASRGATPKLKARLGLE